MALKVEAMNERILRLAESPIFDAANGTASPVLPDALPDALPLGFAICFMLLPLTWVFGVPSLPT